MYHPDKDIDSALQREVMESEIADIKAGYPPRWWQCPSCGAQHDRGHFQVLGIHRCLGCGYVGDRGYMAIRREELPNISRGHTNEVENR